MNRIIYIINIFIFSLSIGHTESRLNVLLFNFNDSNVDLKNEVAVSISNQISDKFIDVMIADISFLKDINFVSSEQLDKQRIFVNKILLDEIKKDFQEHFANVVSRDRIIEIINKASSSNLNEIQINSLADSLISSVEKATKDITKKIMDINTTDDIAPIDITSRDLYHFINKTTAETLRQSTFSSLIASSNKEFNSDIVIVGKYSIIENEIQVILFLYNYSDFSLLDTISSRSSIRKANILIKDLEFKLLKKLGVLLDDFGKETLCRYNAKHFSRTDYSLYFSNIFQRSDIKEMQYRLQLSDDYNLINNHYESFFNGLMEEEIEFKIKFQGNDSYYRVFLIESVNNTSIFVNALKSTWYAHEEIRGQDLSDHSKFRSKDSKMIIEVNYDDIEAIYFSQDEKPFVNLIKQVTIYSFILAISFLLQL